MTPIAAFAESVPLTDVFRAIFFYGMVAELIGVPVAWLRVRKLEAWRERPEEPGPLGLLSLYISKITVMLILWGILVSLSVFAGSKV
jgi:hypothetical protein